MQSARRSENEKSLGVEKVAAEGEVAGMDRMEQVMVEGEGEEIRGVKEEEVIIDRPLEPSRELV
jgi:hypothetical protein